MKKWFLLLGVISFHKDILPFHRSSSTHEIHSTSIYVLLKGVPHIWDAGNPFNKNKTISIPIKDADDVRTLWQISRDHFSHALRAIILVPSFVKTMGYITSGTFFQENHLLISNEIELEIAVGIAVNCKVWVAHIYVDEWNSEHVSAFLDTLP